MGAQLPPPPPYNPWDPPPPQPPPTDFQWGGPGSHPFPPQPPPPHPPFHHHHPPRHFNGPPPDHFNGPHEHFNGPPPPHFNGPPANFNGKRKLFDRSDMNANYAKLYVVPFPRTVCQDEVRHLFEEFGNVIEVVLLTDKKTGQQQEYCFVKYASVEEANRAITALDNQFTFPGAMGPLQLRYADGEKKRLGLAHVVQQDSSLSRPRTHSVGLVQHDSSFSGPVSAEIGHKVYVNGLNREASVEEIVEIFSSYGDVADIYIMRDDLKRSRGCGFVGFSQKCMAMAAINGLNGTYVMRGCDSPLAVRFAEPKKPKNGDFRPGTHTADMRRNVSSAVHLGNSSMCSKLSSVGEQAGTNYPVANQPRLYEIQQMPSGNLFSPSPLCQISLLESQTCQGNSSSCTKLSLVGEQAGTNYPVINQSWSHEIQQMPDEKLFSPSRLSQMSLPDSQTNQSSEQCLGAFSESDYSKAFGECDWSEHICPDGDKYYFNSVTSESRWEKPEEFALCERRIRRHKSQKDLVGKRHRTLETPPPSKEDQIEAAQCQRNSCDIERPQSTVSCAMEHSHELPQDEPSVVGGPAFVQ